MAAAFKNAHPYFANPDMRIMLFETLIQPSRAYPAAKPNFKHVVTCMQVCKAWWQRGATLIWSNIEDHHVSLGALLHQFALDQRVIMSDNNLTWKDKFLRISSQAYPRYKLYAGYVQRLENFQASGDRDVAFCEVLGLLNLRGILFPSLTELGLKYEFNDHNPSFPPQFQTGMLTRLNLYVGASRNEETQVKKLLNEVADYCPLLERLDYPYLVKMDHIMTAFTSSSTPHLNAISVNIHTRDYEKFMTFVLSRANVMTFIQIDIEGQEFEPADHSSRSFPNLRNLKIMTHQLLYCLGEVMRTLPAAPVIETFTLDAMVWGGQAQQMLDSLISHISNYWNRAPYKSLTVTTLSRPGSPNVEAEFAPLLQVRNLITFEFATGASVAAIKRLENLLPAWANLRKLALSFYQPWLFNPSPRLCLHDVLILASYLPHLEELIVMADIREKMNPQLLEQASDTNGTDDMEDTPPIPATDLSRFRNPSIRSFALSSNNLPVTQAFITNVIQQAMPNLEVVTLTIGSRAPTETSARDWQNAMKAIGFSLEKNVYVRD